MSLIIREADVEDVRNLVMIDIAASREIKQWFPQSGKELRTSLKKPDFLFILAAEDKEVVGYLESEYDREKRAVWIKNIYVLKEFRKKGIARLLVKKCISSWKKRASNFILLTADRNLKTFERLGFKKTMNYMVHEVKR